MFFFQTRARSSLFAVSPLSLVCRRGVSQEGDIHERKASHPCRLDSRSKGVSQMRIPPWNCSVFLPYLFSLLARKYYPKLDKMHIDFYDLCSTKTLDNLPSVLVFFHQ